MTHLPKNPFCDTCANAKAQRTQKRKQVVKLQPDETTRKEPVKFGEQVTGYHFIKNGASQDGGEKDPHSPTDTVAVVLYDRGIRWLSVYPKATKTAYHAIESFQHICGTQGSRI